MTEKQEKVWIVTKQPEGVRVAQPVKAYDDRADARAFKNQQNARQAKKKGKTPKMVYKVRGVLKG